MAVELYSSSFLSSSSSSAWISYKRGKTYNSCKKAAALDHLLNDLGNTRQKWLIRASLSENRNKNFNPQLTKFKNYLAFRKPRCLLPLASTDDSVTVNGSPQASTSSDVGEMMVKLDQSLQDGNFNDGIVQNLHEAARVFELAIKEQSSSSKVSWFSTAWLGVDRRAWVKSLSYQASVYCLLQAAIEVSSRGDSRDRDVNVCVQRSLLRQCAPLESLIREKLSSKLPEAYEWFWTDQVPVVVTSFVNYFEADPGFSTSTFLYVKTLARGTSLHSGHASDISLLKLAMVCVAAIIKLGPAKVSCSQFFSIIPDVTGRLMEMLVDVVQIRQAYHFIKDIGLRREFLIYFGPRAAASRVKNDGSTEEVVFWVNLVQKQLQHAIDREKIWSRLTTSESIEILEKDLAVFGFFIALGRSTQSFLSDNGVHISDDALGGFIRYLIGGSVLYYPQLSSISSYQLYVEVVCEELDWLPFYPKNSGNKNLSHGHTSRREGPPNVEAMNQAVYVCSHWIQCFIKYSKWLENPSNVKAAKFLSRGHDQLLECAEELGIIKSVTTEKTAIPPVRLGSRNASSLAERESDAFDKALESVDEALIRLEQLLQELHVSSSSSGKEHLKAACSDLEKIRKLKKEAEFLEASFRAKAAVLQQGDDENCTETSVSGQPLMKGKNRRSTGRPFGLWNFSQTWKRDSEYIGDESIRYPPPAKVVDPQSNEIQRFELLRNELIELEKRVQESTEQTDTEEYENDMENNAKFHDAGRARVTKVQNNNGNVIEKSLDKLKEASTDVWQGTQLLAIDVAAATELIRRALIGDELTDKEKQSLRRTVTDLASVVPIGVLMLLPVTAIGHAAMLAAIQRYVPALIPSTYGQERLDLLRQLEKVKEMKANEATIDENIEELA